MGRLILLILIVLAVTLVWKAFGPSSWKRNQVEETPPPREIKGPDDDEEFLWRLEKERFKERRAKEAEQARREEEARRRAQRDKRRREQDSSQNDRPENGG